MDLLWVCIVILWTKMPTGFQQQQQMVLGALATWGCLQQVIVCWIRHKYFLLSFNCSCPCFIHLQIMAAGQKRHKFSGFCVKSALLLECFFCFVLFFSSSSQFGRDYLFRLLCSALGSVLSSPFLLIEGELLKWGSVYKQDINGGFSPPIIVSGYDLDDSSMFPGNMK